MESVSTDTEMSLGHGLARAFTIQAKISKLGYLKVEHIVASLSYWELWIIIQFLNNFETSTTQKGHISCSSH